MCANDFPSYFDVLVYRQHLNKIETPYDLGPHSLPVPHVEHVYAEASLVSKLVLMKNITYLSEKLILPKKIEEQSHTLPSFNKYMTTIMLNLIKKIFLRIT